jgi:DNA-binding MarR family transcriptional regulator
MTKLSDTQSVILSAASQRTDRIALPLPKSLKGGAAQKVVNALIDKGLLEEVRANRKLNDPVWRETEDARAVTLVVTDAGLAAIGIEVEHQKTKTQKSEPKTTPTERKIREGTKQALVIEMLRRLEGATIAEIVEATSWASHTTRGFLAGAIKKKLGLTIESTKDDARGRIYRLG